MRSTVIGLILVCATFATGNDNAVPETTSEALKGKGEGQSAETQNLVLASPSALPDHDFEAWPAFIEKQFGTNVVGGYSFVVRHKGNIVASGVGGYARMPWESTGPGLRWTTARRMHIASASKPITAVAMLKLWEEHEKQFSLDDPFWPFVKHLFPDATPLSKTITIRHLLTHRSGLTKHGSNLTLADARIGLSDSKNQPPGTTRTYGGHNFLLLRFVIEAISGEPYTQYVVNHVLRPAGVLNMDTKPETDLPVLTYSGLNGQKGNPMADYTASAGGVGWYGSAMDLTAFLHAVSEGKILSKETTELMFSEGLGWNSSTSNGRTLGYMHAGAYGGSKGSARCVVIHYVDGVDVALLINSGQREPTSIVRAAWLLTKKSGGE